MNNSVQKEIAKIYVIHKDSVQAIHVIVILDMLVKIVQRYVTSILKMVFVLMNVHRTYMQVLTM